MQLRRTFCVRFDSLAWVGNSVTHGGIHNYKRYRIPQDLQPVCYTPFHHPAHGRATMTPEERFERIEGVLERIVRRTPGT
jgi:hypothetical protein